MCDYVLDPIFQDTQFLPLKSPAEARFKVNLLADFGGSGYLNGKHLSFQKFRNFPF